MLNQELTSIKGIGPRRAELLGKLGLFSLQDVLFYAPRDYLDYTAVQSLNSLEHGQNAVLNVYIEADARTAYIPGGLKVTTVHAACDGGRITLAWYNQPFRAQQVKAGKRCYACGRVDKSRGVRMVSPTLYDELPGIVPVYGVTKGLSQKVMRDAVAAALKAAKGQVRDTLPDSLLRRYNLCSLEDALFEAHRPVSFEALAIARRRLAFDDAFRFFMMLALMKAERAALSGISFDIFGAQEDFLALLPFSPTAAQMRAMAEISVDMHTPSQMNRLVQGDVGSGKTALAFYAMHIAMRNGYQAALLAPTEILAAQHESGAQKIFGAENVVLLKGGMAKRERDAALKRIKSGEAKLVIGTHALLYDSVEFNNLGLVIADEQHRFGVNQRAKLSGKGKNVDVLILSATPIPRTLSLMLYGDLDISLVDELPPGRKPVSTKYVPQHRRDDMYRFVQTQLDGGAQVYVVCPFVDTSEQLEGVLSVKELYNELAAKINGRVGLLHGQLAAARKAEVANAFYRGDIDVMVSTTVIEVGIDVKNASVMVIENADRFGLAQLHQLRGRVGRGLRESHCFLLSESDSENARERLSILTQTGDGFEIAERDLEMRGPGEFLGKRQHGADEISAFCFARDMDVLKDARRAAQQTMQDVDFDDDAAMLVQCVKDMLELTRSEIAPN